MNEADRRKLYQGYIRILMAAVLTDPGLKRTLLGLPFGRRFAINAANLTWLGEMIRAVEECHSKGLQIPDGLKWLDEPCRQGLRVELLRVVVFKGSDPSAVSEPSSRLRFWIGAAGGPQSWDHPDAADNECWYTFQAVEFPDIEIVFGFSA